MILRLLLSLLFLLVLASPSWARIERGTAGAFATGTTSLTLAFPATVKAGDLLALCVINKYPTNAPTLPTDAYGGSWVATTNGQGSGGLGVDTTDTGHVYTTWYTKIATGNETGNLSVTITSGNSSTGKINIYRNATGLWSLAATNAPVDVALTAWSAVGAADPGVTANDIVLGVCSGGYTDSGSFSAHAITHTGVTYGTVTEILDQPVTDGDDLHTLLTEHLVSSGTSSDVPTYTATSTVVTGGSTAFLRMRESASTPVAFGTIGTVSVGTTSIAPAYPASIAAGDLLVLCVANKYPTNGPSTPSGWTADSGYQASGGIDPDGVDTGHTYATIFSKTAIGSEAGTLSVTITSGNISTGYISRYTKTDAAASWLTATTNGGDTTIDASWSVTGAADPGVQGADMVVVCSATATDSALMTETAEVLAQTGMTYGVSAERVDSGTSSGEDIGIKIVDFVAISGTSSAAPVFTATLSGASAAGASAFLRLRQNSAASPPSGTGFFPAVIQ